MRLECLEHTPKKRNPTTTRDWQTLTHALVTEGGAPMCATKNTQDMDQCIGLHVTKIIVSLTYQGRKEVNIGHRERSVNRSPTRTQHLQQPRVEDI